MKTCKRCGKRVKVTLKSIERCLTLLHDWAVQRRFKRERGY